jgi:hypothetical protein
MAATFRNLATRVTNVFCFEGMNHYSFDNGQFAYEWRELTVRGVEIVRLVCCNSKGRSLANTGRFAEIVSAQHRAISRLA